MNKTKILQILFLSILIGFIYNFLNPKGIPLIRTERKLVFATDEIQIGNSNIVLQDSSKVSFTSIDTIKEKPVNKNDNKSDTISYKSKKTTDDNNFKEPLAIKIDKAYQLFKQGVKFIDARMPEEYSEGHIKGAINIPFDGDESYRSVLNSFSKDEILVTYCSGTDCDLSILLGDELFNKGFKKVYIFFGGWNDWLERGYPISKGEK
jgi:rhodanese-related sulfurtransferase